MKHITYSISDNKLSVAGTSPPKNIKEWFHNGLRDILVSLQCWPNKTGFHTGAYKAAVSILSEVEYELDRKQITIVSGHSMGGAIAQIVFCLLQAKAYTVRLKTLNAYPVSIHYYPCKGENVIYGNDPVSRLFPWFTFVGPIKRVGPKNKWYIVNFKDHLRSEGE